MQFDDDDWYAARYLDDMIEAMHRSKALLVKLSGWFVYSCKSCVSGALLSVYRALLNIYRALLNVYRALLNVYL